MDQVTRDAALRRRPRLTRVQVVAFSILSWLIVFGVVPVEIARRGRRVGWRGGRPSLFNRLGAVVLGLGVSGLAWCLVAHYEPGETVRVSLAPEKLIGTGPYRLTRNPMYLSEEMTLIGWALYFGSPSLSAWVAAMAAAMRFAVGREEKTLEDRFGEAWKEYAAAVPRWL